MGMYRLRRVDALIERLFEELPAIFLVGPRASGKTTTAQRFAKTVLRLDDPALAAAVRADPDGALRGVPEPVLLDEWQLVPEVLGAVKRSVDQDFRPGRFIVTGSVRAAQNPIVWPGTGRLVRITMYGMSIREQIGSPTGSSFFDLVGDGTLDLPLPPDPPDLRGYVALALRSGFPEVAFGMSPRARQAWLSSYIEQLVTRDVESVDGARDASRLRRYLEAYVLNSAGIVDDKTLLEATQVDRRTARSYERLLSDLFVTENVSAWSTNRLTRLTRMEKRYVVEPALLGTLSGVDEDGFLRDGTLLGRLIETFVFAQLRSELEVSTARPRLYHLRQQQGRHEVDVVAELGGQRIIAFEIKLGSAPTTDDARHLTWMRDHLGEQFVSGIIFHTGPRAFRMSDRIQAVPICALWG